METIIQLYANNEIRLKVQTEAARPWRPVDKAADRAAEHRAILLEENGDIRRTVLQHFNKPCGYRESYEPSAWQTGLFGKPTPVKFEAVRTPVFPAELVLSEGSDESGYRARVYRYSDLEARSKCILDITKISQRPPSHWNWGKAQTPKAFGSYARHAVLESGAVIDRKFDRSSTFELTLTLPGSTPAAIEAVANWSGWIVNRQLQFIRRYEKHIRPWWFFVWEFQKRGALHQHWCIAASSRAEAFKAAMQIKEAWYKALQELRIKAGVDCFARKGFGTWKDDPRKWQWHCQEIKKSVAAYFSKYCGKDSVNIRKEARYTRAGKIHYPSRWWGSSSEVKLEVKRWRVEAKVPFLTREAAEELRSRLLASLDGLELTKCYEYEFDITGREVYDRSKGKNRYVSYCHGSVWVLYVKPDKWPSIWQQFCDIVGTPAERVKGDTLMQAIAKWCSEDARCNAYTGSEPEYA